MIIVDERIGLGKIEDHYISLLSALNARKFQQFNFAP